MMTPMIARTTTPPTTPPTIAPVLLLPEPEASSFLSADVYALNCSGRSMNAGVKLPSPHDGGDAEQAGVLQHPQKVLLPLTHV